MKFGNIVWRPGQGPRVAGWYENVGFGEGVGVMAFTDRKEKDLVSGELEEASTGLGDDTKVSMGLGGCEYSRGRWGRCPGGSCMGGCL